LTFALTCCRSPSCFQACSAGWPHKQHTRDGAGTGPTAAALFGIGRRLSM